LNGLDGDGKLFEEFFWFMTQNRKKNFFKRALNNLKCLYMIKKCKMYMKFTFQAILTVIEWNIELCKSTPFLGIFISNSQVLQLKL